jgi:DNA polymerase-3 subunit alpha
MLRKAMGKKDPKVMAKMRADFMSGATAKGINEKKANKIFDLMEYFAGYGFNKSHSTAYAFLAYQTAFLKANYPKHFAAALFTIEAQNTDKLSMYLQEARERGVKVLSPDINRSQLNFSVDKEADAVRFGMTAIKGLGEGAINAIIEARAQLGGQIPSLHALCEVLDMRIANKRVFEALVKSGACDSLIPEQPSSQRDPSAKFADTAFLAKWRARLFASIDAACDHGSRQQRNRDLGQFDMFGGDDEGNGTAAAVRLPEVPPWSEIEQLNFEKESLGLFWSGHPVDRFADDLRTYGARTTADLVVRREAATAPLDDSEESGAAVSAGPAPMEPPTPRVAEEVSIGGIVSGLRPLKTRKGDRMCVFMLEDAAGSIEVVVFPEAFKQCGHLASENGGMVLVKGKFERDDESSRILAAEIVPLEMVRERLARSVAIRLSTPPHGRETFEKLWDVLTHHKGDRRVAFDVEVQAPHGRLRVTVDVNAQIRVRPSEQLVSDVERICGAGSVSLRQ